MPADTPPVHFSLKRVTMRPRPVIAAALTKLVLSGVAILALSDAARAEAPYSFQTAPGKLPKDVVPVEYRLLLIPDLDASTFRAVENIDIEVLAPTSRLL